MKIYKYKLKTSSRIEHDSKVFEISNKCTGNHTFLDVLFFHFWAGIVGFATFSLFSRSLTL